MKSFFFTENNSIKLSKFYSHIFVPLFQKIPAVFENVYLPCSVYLVSEAGDNLDLS